MKILLAGASGFIGRNFIVKAPPDWDITSLYHSNKAFAQFANNFTNVSIKQCNLADHSHAKPTVSGLSEYYDVGLFIWGNSDIGLSCQEPLNDIRNNVMSLVNLITTVKFGKFI